MVSWIVVSTVLHLVSSQAPSATWLKQTVGTDADFRGVCAISSNVAWVSGRYGTVARTTNGGTTWSVIKVPGAENIDFRDIEAFDEKVTFVLSIGPGILSRIYQTTDGGKTWTLRFKNEDPKAFYDALAFWDRDHGIALSDPVIGKFRILVTDDGGAAWKVVPESGMPPALEKEGAFAASGTCLIATGEKDAWFVTGGAKVSRVFHSTDRGRTWTATEAPIPAANESKGIFSMSLRTDGHGLIAGGDFQFYKDVGSSIASTTDGGKSWKVAEARLPFFSGVAWAKDRWVAVGTSGSFESPDGKAWWRLDSAPYNAVSFSKEGEGWAVGPFGRVARFKR